jgi:cytidine deaminase
MMNEAGGGALSPEVQGLTALVKRGGLRLGKEQIEEAIKVLGVSSAEEVLAKVLPIAASYSRCPISKFYVGTAALTEDGNIYLGTNVEFPGFSLNQAIHGEQFLLSRLHAHGEKRIVAFAVNAPPCGHCRQFLNELYKKNEMKINIANRQPSTIFLSDLLPLSFGPEDLGAESQFLSHPHFSLALKENSNEETVIAALEAAKRAYSPYTTCPSGVCLRMKDGTLYCGSYVENAAYNPSLSPFQAALTGLVANSKQFSDIEECVIAERKGEKVVHHTLIAPLLQAIAPSARLRVAFIRLLNEEDK